MPNGISPGSSKDACPISARMRMLPGSPHWETYKKGEDFEV